MCNVDIRLVYVYQCTYVYTHLYTHRSAKSLANVVQGHNIQESDVRNHTDVVHNEYDSTRSTDHHSSGPSVKTCEHPGCTDSCEHPHPCGCTECNTTRELPK